MPDCNHSTASCSCVALLGWGGGDQGGASCARGQQLLGGDMLMVGCVTYKHCHQHLYLTHSHYLHIQLVSSATAGDTGQRREVVLFCPMCPHPLDPTPLLLSANPHKDQSPSVI